MTLTDTGPIVAIFNANDNDHIACKLEYERLSGNKQ